MSSEEITNIYGINHGANISVDRIPEISLVLVQQIAAGHCQHVHEEETIEKKGPTDFQSKLVQEGKAYQQKLCNE